MADFHYIITVQRSHTSGIQSTTASGIITPTPGATRAEVYGQIMGELKTAANIDTDVSCIFFSLKPNVLDGTA